MDKIISWQGICLDCGYRVLPDTQQLVMGEAVLHKMKTCHRILLHGEVKEVKECGRKAVGKLV